MQRKHKEEEGSLQMVNLNFPRQAFTTEELGLVTYKAFPVFNTLLQCCFSHLHPLPQTPPFGYSFTFQLTQAKAQPLISLCYTSQMSCPLSVEAVALATMVGAKAPHVLGTSQMCLFHGFIGRTPQNNVILNVWPAPRHSSKITIFYNGGDSVPHCPHLSSRPSSSCGFSYEFSFRIETSQHGFLNKFFF